jgi:hypothetical protein
VLSKVMEWDRVRERVREQQRQEERWGVLRYRESDGGKGIVEGERCAVTVEGGVWKTLSDSRTQ